MTAKVWIENGTTHIDVRGLGAPEPMVAILTLLEQPEQSGPVIVHHDRNPVYLYPELAERGWGYEISLNEPGNVRLYLTRQGQ